MTEQKNVLILGIGNLLWADEGFGVRAAESLHRHYDFPANVTLMDGGTQGIYLLQFVQDADLLVIFDAVDFGLAPGALHVVEGDDVPNYMGAKKVSLHQTGFQEVLAMAEMLGDKPDEMLLVGVQPVQIEDYGGSLAPLTRSRIEPATEAARHWLSARGITATARTEPRPETDTLAGAEIDMTRYEHDRPSAERACRVGDDRVLTTPGCELGYRGAAVGDQPMSVDVDHRGKY